MREAGQDAAILMLRAKSADSRSLQRSCSKQALDRHRRINSLAESVLTDRQRVAVLGAEPEGLSLSKFTRVINTDRWHRASDQVASMCM